MPIHQETTLPVAPERVYELLTDSAQFAAATERPAEIGVGDGATFSIFGGYIEGRQIELVHGQRIVQAWRGCDWAPGVYSLVRFTLTPEGNGTRLVLDHDGYPEGKSPMYPSWHEHLSTNWPVFYFEPLAKYLAAQSVLEPELRTDRPEVQKWEISKFGVKEIEHRDMAHFYIPGPKWTSLPFGRNTEDMSRLQR